ncbi:uncharacterized protein LOC123552134 [Mercenaria mercenaria]|uniref:uncharacterized protein LOC123552134 n=1 Tax=Mercenaria mercenaria TaxID=6596 RepID=UPI00234F8B6D|nr:uncharacterized protein LOC123552134 [Mercenaria mercenaria]
MEVSGKRVKNTKDLILNVNCEPCEDDDKQTIANGFCRECEQYMCTQCFQHHRKGKFCKDHELLDRRGMQLQGSRKEEDKGSEKCQDHEGEPIKFYCPKHVQAGCGDCMILEHKTCEVEYIRDKAATFKESKEFQTFVRAVGAGVKVVEQLETAIKEKAKNIREVHAQYKNDVETFRDKLINHVKKLANDMLKEGDEVFSENQKYVCALEKETQDLVKDVSVLNQTIESSVELPQKLFVSTVKSMPKLNAIEERLSRLKEKKGPKKYEFSRNPKLQLALTKCEVLGTTRMFTDNKDDVPDAATEKIQASQSSDLYGQINHQSLLQRQLWANNMTVDGNYITFVDDGRRGVGIYADKFEMKNQRYFEVKIVCWGVRGAIGVGVVPEDYPQHSFPGWSKDSIAYHADDGGLFYQKGQGDSFGPVCKTGDRIGCGRSTDDSEDSVVFFTHNGVKIGHRKLTREMTMKKLYPAIGLHSRGEKVKVFLDAEAPN